MKTIALLFLTIAAFAGSAPAAESEFDRATSLYDAGQYQEARSHFDESLSREGLSANLLYDLGNTEFRLQQPGRAILEYERALVLDPAHAEAKANLELARHQTGAELLTPHPLDRLIPPWPQNFTVIAGAMGAWLLIYSAAGILFLGRWEKAGAWLCALVGIGVSAWAGVVIWRSEEHRALAVLITPGASARTAPADRASIVEPLASGSQVRILSERGEWTYCVLPGDHLGWLPSNALGRTDPSEAFRQG